MTNDSSRSPFGPQDQEAARQQEARIRKIARETLPDLPKRFYETASTEAVDGVFQVRLDGRPLRTPAKAVFAVPDEALAEAIATEWAAQVNVIDPRIMPLTRLANVVIDGVIGAPEPLREEIATYAMSDLVCYRAAQPAGLAARQSQHWDPVVDWAETALGIRPVLATGIMPVSQPERLRGAVGARASVISPFGLAAVHVITTMTGSALLAMMLTAQAIGADALWAAAHVDEDWQISQWGEDAEAQLRRAKRRGDFDAAVQMLASCG